MNYSRKEFIKITSLVSITALLNACGISTDDKDNKTTSTSDSTIQHDTLVAFKKPKSPNVIYITKDEADYIALQQGFSKRIHTQPKVIALCLNIKGVQEAVKLATEENLKISIKSGGHCFEGFSSNEGGLVINLSKLNGISFINDTDVSIDGGCKLGDVYDTLLQNNKLIPAGSCSGVGVSGLTLGGGYGLFSREYGLTCDTVLEVEMVTAHGELINTNNHPDLFWALKGGGNGNFGIVTRFIFKTHPAPNFFQARRFKAFHLTEERTQTLLKEWFNFAPQLPNNCFSAFVLNGKTLTVLVTNYQELSDETTNVLADYAKLTDTYKIGSESKVASSLKVFGGQKKPILFKNASVGLYKNYETIEAIIPQVLQKVIHGKGLIYQVNTLGGNIVNKDLEVASCFAHRNFPYLSELQCYWDNEKQNDFHLKQFHEIEQLFFDADINNQYVNYPSINNPNYGLAYYGTNYEKLKEIKRKYDPDNIFNHAQSIKPS